MVAAGLLEDGEAAVVPAAPTGQAFGSVTTMMER
jgi:hypothetical protein